MIPLGVLASSRVAASASYSFIEEQTITTAGTSFSTTHSIGTAAANRTVIVAISLRAGTSVTALTIGGVSATVHIATWDAASAGCVIASAAVPTGTSATVAVTTSATANDYAIGVWVAYGTLAYSTSAGSTVAGASVTITAPANCLTIAGYGASNSAPGPLAGVNVRYTNTTSVPYRAGGDAQPTAGSHTVTLTGSPNFYCALSVVDFTLT